MPAGRAFPIPVPASGIHTMPVKSVRNSGRASHGRICDRQHWSNESRSHGRVCRQSRGPPSRRMAARPLCSAGKRKKLKGIGNRNGLSSSIFRYGGGERLVQLAGVSGNLTPALRSLKRRRGHRRGDL